jgi:hypothetical protein
VDVACFGPAYALSPISRGCLGLNIFLLLVSYLMRSQILSPSWLDLPGIPHHQFALPMSEACVCPPQDTFQYLLHDYACFCNQVSRNFPSKIYPKTMMKLVGQLVPTTFLIEDLLSKSVEHVNCTCESHLFKTMRTQTFTTCDSMSFQFRLMKSSLLHIERTFWKTVAFQF